MATETTLKSRLIHCAKTTAEWSINGTKIGKKGELLLEIIDTNHFKVKVGDGVTGYSSLPFMGEKWGDVIKIYNLTNTSTGTTKIANGDTLEQAMQKIQANLNTLNNKVYVTYLDITPNAPTESGSAGTSTKVSRGDHAHPKQQDSYIKNDANDAGGEDYRLVLINTTTGTATFAPLYGSASNLKYDGLKFTATLSGETTWGGLSTSDFAKLIGGKISLSVIPDSVLGQLEYVGTWNASTGTAVSDARPNVEGGTTKRDYRKGDYLIITTGASAGKLPTINTTLELAVGDWIVFNGTSWDKVDHTDYIKTVAGISPTNGDILIGDIVDALNKQSLIATTLKNARTFSLSGDVTATGVSFDGSANVALATTISDGAVTTAKIADANVTTEKIADGAVTTEKLNNNFHNFLKEEIGNKVTDLESEINTKLTELEEKIGKVWGIESNVAINDRLSKIIYTGHSGEKVVVRILNPFPEDTEWKIFGITDDGTSIDSNKSLSEFAPVSESIEVVVPENDYIGVFMRNREIPYERTYRIEWYFKLGIKYDIETINLEIDKLETSLEETNQKTNNLDNVINGSEIVTWEDVGYSDDYLEINAHRQGRYINFKNFNVGDNISSLLTSNGGAFETAAFARCAIKRGNNYRVFGRADEYASLVITDDSANIITKITSGNYTISPYEFTAESDGYLFVQNLYFDGWDTCKATFKKVEKTNSLVKDVAQLKNVNNPLAGKIFVVFGDSLSEFAGTDGKTYSQHIEDITSAKIINCAIGGTRFGVRNPNYQTPTSEGRAWACVDIANMVYAACSGDYTYIDAGASFLKTLGYNVDGAVANVKSINWDEVYGVIIEGGTNDFMGSVSPTHIGTDDDDDFFTTKGAVNYMVKTILTAHPNVNLCFESNQVVYVAPPNFDASTSYNVGDVCKYESKNYKFINPHYGEWNDSDVLLVSLAKDWRHPSAWCDNYKNFDGLTNAEFIKEIQNLVVHKHHIPYINMYDLLGWNQFNFSTFFEDYDNHHPYKGFKVWADKLSKQLMLL